MRSHASFGTSFWTKGSGKRLRGNPVAQLVGAYLITCGTSNLIGLYYLPLVTLCHELGLGTEDASAALKFCASVGFAFYDFDAELVWVPNMAKIEIGETMSPKDKRRPLVLRELRHFEEHPFGMEFVQRYSSVYNLGETKGHATFDSDQGRGILDSKQNRKPPGMEWNGMGSDPGESEGAPDPVSKTGVLPSHARYADAYALGIQDAGFTFSGISAPWEYGALGRACAHAEGRRGDDLDAWFRLAAKTYRQRMADKGGQNGYQPTAFLRWLDDTQWRMPKARPQRPVEPRSSPEAPPESSELIDASTALQDVAKLFGGKGAA